MLGLRPQLIKLIFGFHKKHECFNCHETVNIGTSIYITKVINIMNKFLYPNNSKIYEKEPKIAKKNFVSPLGLH